MSDMHAVAPNAEPLPGRCTRIWTYSGARIRCEDTVIPGGDMCADCLIEHVHSLPDPDVVPVVERVAFGPFPVPTREVTL
jgi:hypothetical protein